MASSWNILKYIRRLRSYAGAEQLTRQMALELIEYITIDENPNDKKAVRDIHVYYKLIDKPLKDRQNAHIGRIDTTEDWYLLVILFEE